MRNLITDVPGLKVGHAHDARLASGTTAIVFDAPAVAAVDVRGGAPGTRETDLLAAGNLVEHVDAIALSGGSAFGLDAASGVQAALREQGRGFTVATARVPIVPGAVLFDLTHGGAKDWGRYPPYREFGYAAAGAAGDDFALGSVGAGMGATTVNLKSGIGSASATCDSATIGALAAVNAAGSAVVGDGPWFWAAPFEQGNEFGGRGFPALLPAGALAPRSKGAARQNTTLVVIATDAALTRAQARRLAIMAQDGFAHALFPAHTPIDGDIVFAASTGIQPLADPVQGLLRLGAVAMQVVARAIARGVHAADALPGVGEPRDWRDTFGG
jgi:L-aminopeptidase/D-esterase-like protein